MKKIKPREALFLT